MTMQTMAAIHQPHYFPWIPYMNKLAASDVFILYDTVQLPRGKCKELRAKYLLQGVEKWLTIPAGKAKGSKAPIMDVQLGDLGWKKDHLAKLENAYCKARHRDWALELVAECLGGVDGSAFLVDIHHHILEVLVDRLELGTELVRASDLLPFSDMSLQEYVVALLEKVGAGKYFTGQGRGTALTVDENLFAEAGIGIVYQDYAIPHYPQAGDGGFVSQVSVLDSLFMCGPEARNVVIAPERA